MAEQGSLQLEIVTPDGIKLSERVDEVVAPGVRGEFGVLAGHLPMLAGLHIGLVHYKEGGTNTDVGVGMGFVEVIHDKAIILTDRFITKDEVDILTVRERLKDVDDQIESWEGELDAPERLELIEEEQWLATQLELIGDPPPPRVIEHSRSTDYAAMIPFDEIERAKQLPDEDDQE